VSHKTLNYITLESVTTMIGVNYKTQNHIALEIEIIMIGVLLGEKKSNK